MRYKANEYEGRLMMMKLIKVLTLVLALALVVAPSLTAIRSVHANPDSSFAVEPVALSPLTDVNSSAYGLETPATPMPVGDNFTVEIHLTGATGVSGVEVHLFFGNILSYATPTGFTDFLGTAGGVLTGPQSKLLYGVSAGFYDAAGNGPLDPPFTGAVYYKVAAASTGAAQDVTDALVAKITFHITSQPTAVTGTVSFPLTMDFTDIVATSTKGVDTQGTLTIDAPPLPPGQQQYTLTVNVVGNGTVTINPQSPTYLSGTTVTLTAVPENENFTLSAWSGDITGTRNPITITMDGNKTVTATFRAAVHGLLGDLNHDGKVDLKDLVLFESAWGLKKGDPGFITEADINGDGVINLADLVTFAVMYDKSLH
jgi:hypothetical protein